MSGEIECIKIALLITYTNPATELTQFDERASVVLRKTNNISGGDPDLWRVPLAHIFSLRLGAPGFCSSGLRLSH